MKLTTLVAVVAVLTFVSLALNMTSAANPAPKVPAGDHSAIAEAPAPPAWDANASTELGHALHAMHEMWNRGDMDAVENVIAGDDVLVTFELGPDNKTPVALRSKADILNFMRKVDTTTGTQSEKYEMEVPKMNCRATATFGVCTEECTVHLTRDSKTVRVDNLFGTAVAVKYPEGWKWIQWHMSAGQSAPSTDRH